MSTLALSVLALGAAVALLLVGGAAVLAWRVPASRAPLTAAGTVAALLVAGLGVVVAAGHDTAPAPVRISVTVPPAP
ncbi:hypothetical protein AB0904_07080 [Streptomyces sp. NPDC006684]|uniref:hypothetical protein n=1 Tax=Streptomyces sp. NPDC006684 TaxID=3154477 RepID=UPI00345734AB